MFNHYFDVNGMYTFTTQAYPGTAVAPDCVRSETELKIPEGFWPVRSTDNDGFDMLENHRGKEGYVDGNRVRIDRLGPLPEGWSDAPPKHIPSEEETALMEKAEAEQLLFSITLKSTAENATLSDEDVVKVASAGFYDEWEPGEKYTAGKRLTYQGGVFEVIQEVEASQQHQPPGAAGMLAIYRPVGAEGENGTPEHPIAFIDGMDVEQGQHYFFAGKLWLAKANMKPCVWNPGTVGMWQWELVE